MLDTKFKVRRFIAEFSEKTEELIAEHELSGFDLVAFRDEFGVKNPEEVMFDCYEIREANIAFINGFVSQEINWDFSKSSYFLEAHGI